MFLVIAEKCEDLSFDISEVYGFTGTNNGIENDRIPKHCQLAPLHIAGRSGIYK